MCTRSLLLVRGQLQCLTLGDVVPGLDIAKIGLLEKNREAIHPLTVDINLPAVSPPLAQAQQGLCVCVCVSLSLCMPCCKPACYASGQWTVDGTGRDVRRRVASWAWAANEKPDTRDA